MFGRSPADLQQLSFYLRSWPASAPTPASSASTPSSRRRSRRTCARRAPASRSASAAAARCSRRSSPGFLFTAGYSLPTIAMVLAVGSLLGAGMLLLLKLEVTAPSSAAARLDRAADAGPRASTRSMKRSVDRILTTHVGSLIRPAGAPASWPRRRREHPQRHASATCTRWRAPRPTSWRRQVAGRRGHRQRRRIRQVELGQLRARSHDRLRAAARHALFEAVWLGRDRVRFREFMEDEFPRGAIGVPGHACVGADQLPRARAPSAATSPT